MFIDKELVPYYLTVLKSELKSAMNCEGAFADHNGMVYLSEAIDFFEVGLKEGLDHTEMRLQTWNAVSTMTPEILISEGLSDTNYGKIVKIYWTTDFENAIKDINSLEDDLVKYNTHNIANWIRSLMGISR